MNTCLICPIPSLFRYIDEGATHHLLLAHLLSHPEYVSFYRTRAELGGDYIILDNGAKELGAGLRMLSVLKGAEQVGAKEVVLTDVRFKAGETIRAAQQELMWMRSLKGRIAYENAGCPKLMIVPQGTNETQWNDCRIGLLNLVETTREVITEMPDPCVAYAYHYDHLFRGGLLRLLSKTAAESPEIHLLGWTRNLETLEHAAKAWPKIRSVDSGKPFSFAKAGLPCLPRTKNPGRDINFFTERMPDDKDELTRSNINIFRRVARSESPPIRA